MKKLTKKQEKNKPKKLKKYYIYTKQSYQSYGRAISTYAAQTTLPEIYNGLDVVSCREITKEEFDAIDGGHEYSSLPNKKFMGQYKTQDHPAWI